MLFIKVYEEKETFNANLVHIISFPKENDYHSNKRIHLQIKNHFSIMMEMIYQNTFE